MSDLFLRTLENTLQSRTTTVEQQPFMRNLRDANRQIGSGPTVVDSTRTARPRSSVNLRNPLRVAQRGAAEISNRVFDATGIDYSDPLSWTPVAIAGHQVGIDVPETLEKAGDTAQKLLDFITSPVGAAVTAAGAVLLLTR